MKGPFVPSRGVRWPAPASPSRELQSPEPYPGFSLFDPGWMGLDGQPHVRDYLAVLRRRKRWVLGIFLLVVAGGGWITHRTTPVFEARTTIRIESPELETPILSELTSLRTATTIATEMQMLESRSLAEAVVRELGLNVRVVDPAPAASAGLKEWLLAKLARPGGQRSELIDSVSVVSAVKPGQYVLAHEGGSWTAARKERELARASDGQPLEFAGVRLRPRAARPGGTTIVLGVARLRDAVASFLAKLEVTVPVRDAHVVRVTYRDPDPELARAAVDAAATRFIANSFLANRSQARSTREFIEDQLAELSRNLERTEAELQAYKEEAGVVALPAEAEQEIRSFATFETERDRYATERDALVSLMGRLERPGGDITSDLSTFPAFIENDAVQQLEAQLNELTAVKTRLLIDKTPAHPDVVTVQQQIDELRADLRRAAEGYRIALESRIAALDKTLGGLMVGLDRLPEKETRLARLVRKQQVESEQYAQLQMKLKEAQIAEAVKLASIRVVDPALTPESPVKPNPRWNLTMAAILGLFLGCGAAFVREYFDDTVRSKEHAERELQLPIYGVIPLLRPGPRWALPSPASSADPRESVRRAPRGRNGSRRTPGARQARLLLTNLPPRSAGAEAYRALRANLALLPTDAVRRGNRSVLVTSPGSGDGKSIIAANLAIAFAQQGNRTVLVDADLRKSVQHRLFEVEHRKGLTDYLLRRADVTEIVHRTTVPGLYLVPSGATPSLPCELLGSHALDDLLEKFASGAEVLILDSPPVLPVADAVVLSRKVDRVLLVIRAGLTDKAAAAEALAGLGGVDANRVTGALNAMDYLQAFGRAYYRHYYEPYYASGGKELEEDRQWHEDAVRSSPAGP